MRRTCTIVIGGGQAGLAMSRSLFDHGIDHVVLERGRIAERWRSERWSSLRLLTPNWQTRLPSWRYRGDDPHGFMRAPEVAQYLADYAQSFAAPVQEQTSVLAVRRTDRGYHVSTDRGTWHARAVVIATGACDEPFVPAIAGALPARIEQIVPSRYRRPEALAEGGVLVVGASASGVQIADEIHRSGRPVTLAVGRHVRLPRRYRGRDIMHWLDRTGVLDETPADVVDLAAARRQPSLQLVGRPDHANIDLATLRSRGVTLVGRLHDVQGTTLRFAPDLPDRMRAADAKLARLLARIDRFAATLDWPIERESIPPIPVVPSPDRLDLRTANIRTVVWATGYRQSWPWLRVPVLDARGELIHQGGITPSAGLYVLGLRFLRRRKSTYIDGVGQDARELGQHIAAALTRDRYLAA